jgi:hypothetical protein
VLLRRNHAERSMIPPLPPAVLAAPAARPQATVLSVPGCGSAGLLLPTAVRERGWPSGYRAHLCGNTR